MPAISTWSGSEPAGVGNTTASLHDVGRLLAANQLGGVLDTASLATEMLGSAGDDSGSAADLIRAVASVLEPLDRFRLEADILRLRGSGATLGDLQSVARGITDEVADVLTRTVAPLSPDLSRGIDRAAIGLGLARYDPGASQMLRPVPQGVGEAIEKTPGQILLLGARQTQADIRPRPETVTPDEGVGSVTERSATVGRNEATWTLDAVGRPIRAEATLREVFVDLDRSSAEQRAQGEAADRGVDGDHGGHIIGHRFVKDQGLDNLFPQNGDFNISAYKTLENEMADWVETGAEVRIAVDLLGGGDRPERVRVVYEVVDPASGDVVYDNNVLFRNAADQTFDRTPSSDMKDVLAG
jgi:hypothetical protein